MGVGIKGFGGIQGGVKGVSALPPAAVAAKGIFGASPPAIITPTTWDNSIANSVVYSNGDLTATVGSNLGRDGTRTLVSRNTGKYYWEITLGSPWGGVSSTPWGIGSPDLLLTDHGSTGTFWFQDGTIARSLHSYNGSLIITNDSVDSSMSGWATELIFPLTGTSGDVLQVALDVDNGKVWFGANGTWIQVDNQTDPDNGLNAASTFSSQSIMPYIGTGGTNQPWGITANFGSTAFNFTVPTGFSEGFGNDV